MVGPRPAVNRDWLLARSVGEGIGVGDEVEEVVRVQMGDENRVNVEVVAEAPKLGEHAVAAIQQQRLTFLLDQVAAARPVGVLPRGRLAQDRDAHADDPPQVRAPSGRRRLYLV